MTDLNWLTIAEAAERIEKRELTPTDLVEACLSQIEATEPKLNAFITVMADAARTDATCATDEIARGSYRGSMHGIPIGLKDIFEVAGVKNTAACKIFADDVAEADSGVAERLREAGAIIIGKLNLHEIALGATGIDSHFGPARNPWDTERVTGGSSSGSGASVAGGECFGALGTDTGGSVRIPASLCGIVGMKATFGRVSRRGITPLSWSLDHAGPMTRTVEDCAILLQAIAGRDAGDPSSIDEPVPDYGATLRDGVRGLRIGVPDTFFFDQLDSAVGTGVREAIRVLDDLGAVVTPISLPFVEDAPNAVSALMLPEALAYHHKWMAERPEDYSENVRYRLEIGATFLAVHHVQAQRFREMIVAAWRDKVFSKVDLLATPTTPSAAGLIDRSDLAVTLSLIRNTNPLNLLAVPTISVPCGFTDGGMPFGLQLAGRWWDEATVFRAAYAYEQATDWRTRRPAL